MPAAIPHIPEKSVLSRKRGKYVRHTEAEKRRIVEETLVAGASVSVVARRHDVNANQVFNWRQQYRRGAFGSGKIGAALVPIGIICEKGVIAPVPGTAMMQKPQSGDLSPELNGGAMPTRSIAKLPKMIEIELRSGTRIKIDAGVKGAALQQVLKLIRSLA